ncbi:Pentatricopeptide repeat-containing protein [Platanthera guangdongensis]|uniref:Pentatricopeptide repeat-containing protein n=1 Tax=Platanthera guangdongensis TaxID=2320717 RepID=A0ABR2MFU1_9ASPA
MTRFLYCLQRSRSLPPKPQSFKSQALLLRSIFSIPTPNPSSHRVLLLLSSRISNPRHLRQLLCRAAVSGLHFNNLHLHLLNSILHSLSLGPAPSLALSLFQLIHSQGLAIDDYTFTSALKAISRLSQPNTGAEIHSLVIKLGLEFDTFALNSLIHMYSSCGYIDIARRVLDLAPDSSRDVVSWNSMVSGYFHNELYAESARLFVQMVDHSMTMDANTLVGALRSCAKIGALNLGSGIHSLVVTGGVNMDSYLGSSLISFYGKCGDIDNAQKMFDEMPVPERNAVCWTALISSYSQLNRFGKAIELFGKMQAERSVKPDDNAIASVLSSCAQLGALDQGRYIHAYCDSIGIGFGLSVKNALIDMYSKCGDIERALCVFRQLDRPDVFSWTTIISGLAMNGNSLGALELFSHMEASGLVAPNQVTFLGVLSACSHGGLIEQGYDYFNRMGSKQPGCSFVELNGVLHEFLSTDKSHPATEIIYEILGGVEKHSRNV